MGVKKKIKIISVIMLVILLILPLILINISEPYEFMGIMIILFFVVNPITLLIINLMIGKDVKKIWWIPIFFSIIFLLSYWFVLKEIILDLIVYAIGYLVIGLIFMLVSVFLSKKIK